MRSLDTISPRGGILRHARRPLGWRAPGPAPAPAPSDEASPLWPGEGEDLCWLSGDWRLLQRTDGHRFSADDLFTAYFAARLIERNRPEQNPPARILDLGCGIGSVLLLLAWRFPAARVVGVEAQPISAALARRSLAWNQASTRCEVRDGDLRDPAILADDAPFDLVTGTPPYFPRGTGLESDHVQKGPCRFEHRGGIEAYAKTAAAKLAPGAPFVACAPTSQEARVHAAAAAAGLVVERWQDIIPRAGKAPLFSVFAMRAASRPDALAATDASTAAAVREEPLIVRDANGFRTADMATVRQAMGMPP